MHPIRSMTGFGAGTSGDVSVEIRAVNHRFCDVRVRADEPLRPLVSEVEKLVKSQLERGRCEVSLVLVTHRSDLGLDMGKARAVLQQLTPLRDELAAGEPLLPLLGALSHLWASSPEAPDLDQLRGPALEATQQACDALAAMRCTEGSSLAADLRERASALRSLTDRAITFSEARPALHLSRMRERLGRILESASAVVDEARLAQEVAILADRGDITEELTRLSSHFDQLDALLGGQDLAPGRKLLFLVQELLRETNTIASKANDVALAGITIEMKAEIERLREQANNLL